jgi:acyl-CoA synthetase (NDP forming)
VRPAPTYRFPESAARALAHAARRSAWLARAPGRVPELPGFDGERARAICRRQSGWLLPDAWQELLAAAGIQSLPAVLCRTAVDAAAAAHRLGFPVAVKLASATLTHKSEWDGVRLHLRDGNEVVAAFRAIQERLRAAGREPEFAGVSVQPMAKGGAEVMIGATDDPQFGPLVAFGLGGVLVELLRDVVVRGTPLTDRDADEMLEGIKGSRLLQGFRGAPPADRAALRDIVLRVGRLMDEVQEIRELDLNPVFARAEGEGAVVADARVRVGGRD